MLTTEQDERIRERIAKFLRRSLVANRLREWGVESTQTPFQADAATKWLAGELWTTTDFVHRVLEGVYPCPLVLFLRILHILGSRGIASDNLINLMDDISEICSEK